MQPASFCETDLCQCPAFEERPFFYAGDARRNRQLNDPAANKPLFPDRLYSLWDDRFFKRPDVPKQTASEPRLSRRQDIRGPWYATFDVRGAALCHAHRSEVVAAAKRIFTNIA